jgi:hypothetical protein
MSYLKTRYNRNLMFPSLSLPAIKENMFLVHPGG